MLREWNENLSNFLGGAVLVLPRTSYPILTSTSLWSEREVFDESTSMMLLVSLVITRSSTLSRRVQQSTICDRKLLETEV